MAGYVYLPLDANQDSIRLLRLKRGRPHDDIRCCPFESYLRQEDRLAYKALSYTWGSLADTPDTPNHYILVEQFLMREDKTLKKPEIKYQLFSVTENLHSALRKIRRQDEDVILWADAICINQENETEKGQQVKQMGSIYESADEVLIWLGPDVPGIESLMNSITWIDMRVTEVKASGKRQDRLSLAEGFMKDRFIRLGPEAYSIQQRALKDLLGRPWFTRVWILQEIAKARKATIMCGSYSCPARTFAIVPQLMGLNVNEYIQAVLDIMPQLRENTWWSSKRSLHFLLEKFAESQASVLKDKVYALLGLSEDACDPTRFYPTYGKSDPEVFRDTACFLLFGEILDEKTYPLPYFTLSDLCRPVMQLAERTIDWTCRQKYASAAMTAELLNELLNNGKLEKVDLLQALARRYGKTAELLELLSLGDVEISLNPTTGVDTFTLKVVSTSQISAGKELDLSSPIYSPYGGIRNELLELVEVLSQNEYMLRRHGWSGDLKQLQRQIQNDDNIRERHDTDDFVGIWPDPITTMRKIVNRWSLYGSLVIHDKRPKPWSNTTLSPQESVDLLEVRWMLYDSESYLSDVPGLLVESGAFRHWLHRFKKLVDVVKIARIALADSMGLPKEEIAVTPPPRPRSPSTPHFLDGLPGAF